MDSKIFFPTHFALHSPCYYMSSSLLFTCFLSVSRLGFLLSLANGVVSKAKPIVLFQGQGQWGCFEGRAEILHMTQDSIDRYGLLTDDTSDSSLFEVGGAPAIGWVYPGRISYSVRSAHFSLSGFTPSIPWIRT